ncbi:MAG: DUF4112 domain-containing protein [Pyrinomonadaceae bacterium]
MKSYKVEEQKLARQMLEQPGRRVEIDDSLQRLSWLMDDLIKVPGLGWRFGLDALVGLIPGLGDTATSLVSFYVLASAVRYGVPKVTLLRMGLNIGIDYVVGSLPLVGDLFDAWWKSNQRNVALLSERATVSAAEAREGKLSDWLFVGVIILLLAGLAVGAAAVSLFFLMLIASQFSKAL